MYLKKKLGLYQSQTTLTVEEIMNQEERNLYNYLSSFADEKSIRVAIIPISKTL